jgi:hypothetical protein
MIMSVLSFIAMYIAMYAMVNTVGNIYNNLNKFYMAGLMTAPMGIIGILVMGPMYTNKRLNILILAVSLIALLGFFLFIRQQTAISDRQFLRAMIPHHSSAILMCERAPVEDPEIQKLCHRIIESQQAENDQMKDILNRLGQ